MINKERIYYLLQQHLDKHITPEETEELVSMLQDRQHDPLVSETLQRFMEEQAAGSLGDISRWDGRIAAILNMDKEPVSAVSLFADGQPPVHRVHLLKRSWFRYAAAIIVLVGIGGTVWLTNHNKDIATTNGNKHLPNDVLPGGNKAVLTLAGGQKIILDSAANGTLARQGNVTIVKTNNDQLAYHGTDKTVTFNTLSTPRGGQYRLKLPDGTDVWLNAASSITYPTAFIGRERKVTITGEAYFEVVKDKAKPFLVKVNDMEVDVLGTHFNINSYADEGSVKTTLLEGSVKVVAGNDVSAILKPSQQAVAVSSQPLSRLLTDKTDRQLQSPAVGLKTQQRLVIIDHADVDQVMAWKNGLFNFEGADLKTVMQQLARWYDIDVKYEGDVSKQLFHGEITRDLNLSQVLKLLEDVEVKFKIEGKTLTVTQ